MILTSWIQMTNFVSRTSSGQYSIVKERIEYLGKLRRLIRKWGVHANDFLEMNALLVSIMVSNSCFVRPSIYYYHRKPANLKDDRLFPTLSSQIFQSKKELGFSGLCLREKGSSPKVPRGNFWFTHLPKCFSPDKS